ncbi:MAG: hypothetical protein AVDCRST_MAG22-3021 [uncultured Rubrobacteraceae bacterium]|uniref:Uncharacterized protein n=1 Tax=uncultured Rubrobacteraceae bacterium TaxID=349277 RepID=A0A6J4PY01_9ACTN|nr:MAG: hypothetical protein AVDCRST_MAG22-3021 [uncultured Rubrobacteraceae bacterium]
MNGASAARGGRIRTPEESYLFARRLTEPSSRGFEVSGRVFLA